ncbi:MAG: carbohydrate binding family 9 domain-containing protein [Armatimonadetes bacterium]|nr:carbohydrate binding family 9 domain-containing protein [Armatimonadota bacterium]
MRRPSLVAGLLMAGLGSLAAEEIVRPPVAAVVVAQPPKVDGVLDDPCWKQAAHVDGFVFPTENRPATEPTEGWVCLDDSFLYAAIYAHDSKPDTILQAITQRQVDLGRDDYVSFYVDPVANGVEKYAFSVNPRGTMSDAIPQIGSDNYAWKGVWKAAAKRVKDGYCVEIAIPLKMLRYRNGQTRFGVGFMRNLEREEEQSFWPPMRDRYESHKLGILEPLALKPRHNVPLFMPYVVGRLSEKEHATVQAGLDVRHLFGTGVMGLATLNPDFRNIEDVVDTIAFSYTPRQLGETRPFFGEGSGFFPGSGTWYSRQVPNIIGGLKTYGRMGRHDVGLLGTWSDHGRLDAVGNYVFRLNDDASLSAGMVWRDAPGDPTNVALSGGFHWFEPMGTAGLSADASVRQSFTNGPGGDGNTYYGSLSYSGNGHVGGWVNYNQVNPSFKALDGYVPDADLRGWSTGIQGGVRSQGHLIQEHSWSASVSEYLRSDGTMLSNGANASLYARYRFGMNTTLSAYVGQRPPHHDWSGTASVRWGLESAYDEGGLSVTFGRRGSGDYFYARLDQGWQPMDRLLFSLASEYTYRYFGLGGDATVSRTQNLLTASYRLDDFSAVSARLVERAGDINLFVAYRMSPLSGDNLSLLYGDPNARTTKTQVQTKLTWPF